MVEKFVHWTGSLSDSFTAFGQDIQVDLNSAVGEPNGGLHIHAVGWGGTPVYLPNSTPSAPTWDNIPGTSPALQVRQDGFYPQALMRIRLVSNFTTLTPIHANITVATAVPPATRILDSGQDVRMRGFLQATGVVPASTVLANIDTTTHRPRVNKSMGVRYTAGSSRFQIFTNGDVTLGSALALNDQIWLDSTTYDLLV